MKLKKVSTTASPENLALSIENMNKAELDTYAKETYDINLDRRKSLSKMIKELKAKTE